MNLDVPDFWRDLTFTSQDALLDALSEFSRRIAGQVDLSPQQLLPKPKSRARSNSLSSKYGLGEFPPHTDGAHLRPSPRFVVLWSLHRDDTNTPTYLRRFVPALLKPDLYETLKESVWSVRIRDSLHFYKRPLSPDGSEIAWDPGCFVHDRTGGLQVAEVDAAFRDLPHEAVFWKSGVAVIINNRRVLHSRAALTHRGAKRELFRLYIY